MPCTVGVVNSVDIKFGDLALYWPNIALFGKNKCSATIWPILLLNSVQIVSLADRRLLNNLLMQDYNIPFVSTAIQ